MGLFYISDILTTWADGVSKALRVKAETQLMGSSIPETEAIPQRRRNAVSEQIGIGVSVAAGAAVAVLTESVVDVDDVAVFGQEASYINHSWDIIIAWRVTSNYLVSGVPDDINSVTDTYNGIGRTQVKAEYASYRIRNNDTVDHNYNMQRMKWPR